MFQQAIPHFLATHGRAAETSLQPVFISHRITVSGIPRELLSRNAPLLFGVDFRNVLV